MDKRQTAEDCIRGAFRANKAFPVNERIEPQLSESRTALALAEGPDGPRAGLGRQRTGERENATVVQHSLDGCSTFSVCIQGSSPTTRSAGFDFQDGCTVPCGGGACICEWWEWDRGRGQQTMKDECGRLTLAHVSTMTYGGARGFCSTTVGS